MEKLDFLKFTLYTFNVAVSVTVGVTVKGVFMKKRISISLTPTSIAILEKIAKEAGATKSEVIEKYLKRKNGRGKNANTNTKESSD